MKTKKWISLLVALFLAPALFAGNYTVDTAASTVKWNGKKVTGEHNGAIDLKEGTLEVQNGVIKGGTVAIDMQTISDDDSSEKLVGHLKSEDFFSVETYPTSKLVLTNVKKSGNEYTFTGDLTIKGKTNPVTFTAVSTEGDDEIKVAGDLTIDRSKYDVRYGSKSFFENLGDKVIYDDFTLNFVLVAKK
ncbi:YceI family protein [Sunxiuqinia sp. A32]